MRKRFVTCVALALCLTSFVCLPWVAAQETQKQVDLDRMETESYKVVLTVNELENGKKINSRSYSLRLRSGGSPPVGRPEQIRVGSRVPYAVEADKFQYVDVGMDLDCRLFSIPDGRVVINANWEYSSMGGDRVVNRDTRNPVIHRVRSNVEAVISLDKPTVLTEMDDVASIRSYVFEVKVTKINP